jgi:formate hydrogenlyase subunit 4
MYFHLTIPYVIALLLAPFLFGVVNRTKAIFAGRKGQPLLQAYYDLAKLLRKGAVYSQTTTWVFRAGPIVGLACVLTALVMLPCGGIPAPLYFTGDFLLVIYLLGLMRFFTVAAALDTGSSFEGMGASREVQIFGSGGARSSVEPHRHCPAYGIFSLSLMFPALASHPHSQADPILLLATASLLLVFLSENARIPVDDPNTHLELTMIHEVMVLDHSGPDFGFILYSAILKFWILGMIVVSTILPWQMDNLWLNLVVCVAGMLVLSVVVGMIESSMARLRLLRVPQLLVGASALAILALILELR